MLVVLIDDVVVELVRGVQLIELVERWFLERRLGDAGAADTGASADDASSITVDGQKIAMPTTRRATLLQAAANGDRQGLAVVSIGDASGGISVSLTFPGGKTGMFDCTGKTSVLFSTKSASSFGASTYNAGVSGTGETLGSCTIAVTAFGAVGEPIVGTFRATVQKSVGGSSLPAQRTIDVGAFHVLREPDS